MHEKHAGRAADRASAMAATADIVGEEHFPAAASVLFSIAGFDLKCAGKHDEQLTPRGRVSVLIEAFGHLRHDRALRWQNGRPADGIAVSIGRRIDSPLTKTSARTRTEITMTPGAFRGTDGSNPVLSSGESGANSPSCRYTMEDYEHILSVMTNITEIRSA
jgi:hypothetical protein